MWAPLFAAFRSRVKAVEKAESENRKTARSGKRTKIISISSSNSRCSNRVTMWTPVLWACFYGAAIGLSPVQKTNSENEAPQSSPKAKPRPRKNGRANSAQPPIYQRAMPHL